MRRPIEKLLAMLLALLLGLSPLQGAWASFAAAAGQWGGFQQSSSEQGHGMHMTRQQTESQHKPDCHTHPCCQSHSGNSQCGFAHCGSCLPALLADFSLSANPVVASTYGMTDSGSPNHHYTPILRPPKA